MTHTVSAATPRPPDLDTLADVAVTPDGHLGWIVRDTGDPDLVLHVLPKTRRGYPWTVRWSDQDTNLGTYFTPAAAVMYAVNLARHGREVGRLLCRDA